MSDLSPLAKLKSLKELDLRHTQVSDLSPLAELKNLEHLVLNDTQVSDLSALVELNNLRTLYLENTQVRDLSPLAESNLFLLVITGTQVNDEHVQTLERTMTFCRIYDADEDERGNPPNPE